MKVSNLGNESANMILRVIKSVLLLKQRRYCLWNGSAYK